MPPVGKNAQDSTFLFSQSLLTHLMLRRPRHVFRFHVISFYLLLACGLRARESISSDGDIAIRRLCERQEVASHKNLYVDAIQTQLLMIKSEYKLQVPDPISMTLPCFALELGEVLLANHQRSHLLGCGLPLPLPSQHLNPGNFIPRPINMVIISLRMTEKDSAGSENTLHISSIFYLHPSC